MKIMKYVLSQGMQRFVFAICALLSVGSISVFGQATTYTLTMTGPATDDQGSCNAYTVSRTFTSSGKNAPLSGLNHINLALSGSGGGSFYSDSVCSTTTTSVALLQNNYQTTFYFKDSVVETLTLSVTFTGYTPGSESVSIRSTSAENLYCQPGDVANFGLNDGPAALPTACIYTDLSGTPAPNGIALPNPVRTASDLTTALANVTCGQKILIDASSSISTSAPFTLRSFSCTGANANTWVWIQSNQTGAAGFPAEHVRATPCAIGLSSVPNYPSYPCSLPAILMPTIQTTKDPNMPNMPVMPVFVAASGANHYRLMGLNITKAVDIDVDNKLVDLSGGSGQSVGADHIILDRDLVHGVALNCTRSSGVYSCSHDQLQGGVNANNSTYIALINSWAYDNYCAGLCVDAQAFATGTGARTEKAFKIYNNLLAATGESFFSGGGGQGAGIPTPIATDFEVRQNHSYKPVSWALATATAANPSWGQHPEFKNNGEFKNGDRALVEANEFENSWTGWQTDQAGFQFLITPKNQGKPTSAIPVTIDSTGALTTTASFPSLLISANCAIPNHCKVDYTYIPSGTTTSITVSSMVQTLSNCTSACTGMTVAPALPASTSGTLVGYQPGLCPGCYVRNVTVRYNEFRNSARGIQFATVKTAGGDQSSGMNSVEIHDNLLHGVNATLSNSQVLGNQAQCFEIENGLTNTPINTFTFEHNTCAVATAGPSSSAGLDISLDLTNSTVGGTGGYFSNRIIRNNIGPAGGQIAYKQGTLYPGGLYAGLQQQSCTGLTCSWTYTHNVLGLGLWTNQVNNTPVPCTNADTDTGVPACLPSGGTVQACGSGNATCWPKGAPGSTSFASQFVGYNGPSGQPAYLGDYHLAPTSPYKGQGTDTADIGANIDMILSKTANVRSDTVYTSAMITTVSLPNGTVGSPYSQQLLGTSASDMQVWTFVSGQTLPSGLKLSPSGALSWQTPTAVTNQSIQVQLMDAAQQYDRRTLTLTVQ